MSRALEGGVVGFDQLILPAHVDPLLELPGLVLVIHRVLFDDATDPADLESFLEVHFVEGVGDVGKHVGHG